MPWYNGWGGGMIFMFILLPLTAYLPPGLVALAVRRRLALAWYAAWQGLLGLWSGTLMTVWLGYGLAVMYREMDRSWLVVGPAAILIWIASGIGVLRGRRWAWVTLTLVSINPIWWVVTPAYWLARRYRARRQAHSAAVPGAEPGPQIAS